MYVINQSYIHSNKLLYELLPIKYQSSPKNYPKNNPIDISNNYSLLKKKYSIHKVNINHKLCLKPIKSIKPMSERTNKYLQTNKYHISVMSLIKNKHNCIVLGIFKETSDNTKKLALIMNSYIKKIIT
jgi:hypothetical protein